MHCTRDCASPGIRIPGPPCLRNFVPHNPRNLIATTVLCRVPLGAGVGRGRTLAMSPQRTKSILVRFGGVFCFMLAFLLLVLASWLFVEGDLPEFSLDGRTHMVIAGISVNGSYLPHWTFYLLPGGLYLVSVALLFLGWRLVRSGHGTL